MKAEKAYLLKAFDVLTGQGAEALDPVLPTLGVRRLAIPGAENPIRQGFHGRLHELLVFPSALPEQKLRVISPDVGGGFGTKIPNYPEEVITPLAAMKFNRPVKWVATRSESAMSDTQGRDHVTKAKLAFNNDGTVTGLGVETCA